MAQPQQPTSNAQQQAAASPPEQPDRHQHEPVTGTDTVTVACKLPHGLVLKLYEPAKQFVPVPGGGIREEEVMKPVEGAEITVAGNAFRQDTSPRFEGMNNFALTRGVPKDFWDTWVRQNRRAKYVTGGFIFAYEDRKIEGATKERMRLQTGLERVDPNNIPARMGGSKVKIETAKA